MDTAKNIIKNWIQILNAVVVEEINEKKKNNHDKKQKLLEK